MAVQAATAAHGERMRTQASTEVQLSVDFGEVLVNTTVTRNVTLTFDDLGGEITGVGEAGPSAPFTASLGTCGGFSGPGTSDVAVSFAPTTAGPASSTFSFSQCSDTACAAFRIALSGTGVTSFPADLAVSMSGAPKPVPGPKPVTFSLNVQNLGPHAATGVAVTDTLPAGGQLVSVTSTQGSCNAPPVGSTGTMSCALGTLANGATATITVTIDTTIKKEIIENTATATADSTITDPNPANNTATAVVQVK